MLSPPATAGDRFLERLMQEEQSRGKKKDHFKVNTERKDLSVVLQQVCLEDTC